MACRGRACQDQACQEEACQEAACQAMACQEEACQAMACQEEACQAVVFMLTALPACGRCWLHSPRALAVGRTARGPFTWQQLRIALEIMDRAFLDRALPLLHGLKLLIISSQ